MSGFHSHFQPTGYPTAPPRGGPSGEGSNSSPPHPYQSPPGGPVFDIFEWHPAYQSCQRYFIDRAQHSSQVQAVADLINIRLPFQWLANPVASSAPLPHAAGQGAYNLPWPLQGGNRGQAPPVAVSLVPFIRRLIVTGMDNESIMHGFFGDDWVKGLGPIQECERRNYLFMAKSGPESGGWATVKAEYDMSPHETVPFLKPPQNVQEAEIVNCEHMWSQWLAMEDWLVGPRAIDAGDQEAEASGRNNAS